MKILSGSMLHSLRGEQYILNYNSDKIVCVTINVLKKDSTKTN